MVKDEHPPFLLGKDEFDRSTYSGRFRHFINVINPAALLKSENDIRSAEELLTRSKIEANGGIVHGFTNSDMWEAQMLVQSAVHPDTGDIIPKPFRMGGYIPFNVPILVGLLIPQGTAMTAFWQWLNQTHNALINYSNRNAKTPVTTFQQVSGYSIAVGSALAISFGCNNYLKKNTARMNPRVAAVATSMVPFVAVAFANCSNTAAMRNAELTTGIDVYNKETKEVYGISKVAAKEAIGLTCVSRVVIASGCLVAPPIITAGLTKMNLVNSVARPRQFILAQLVICTVCFFTCLPAAIAIFPQYGQLSTKKLEPDLAKKIEADFVTYNKGL